MFYNTCSPTILELLPDSQYGTFSTGISSRLNVCDTTTVLFFRSRQSLPYHATILDADKMGTVLRYLLIPTELLWDAGTGPSSAHL
jgi:hypothetical protein